MNVFFGESETIDEEILKFIDVERDYVLNEIVPKGIFELAETFSNRAARKNIRILDVCDNGDVVVYNRGCINVSRLLDNHLFDLILSTHTRFIKNDYDGRLEFQGYNFTPDFWEKVIDSIISYM